MIAVCLGNSMVCPMFFLPNMPWQESACGDADPSGEGPAWHWEDLRGFRRVDPTTFLLNVKMDHKLFFRGTLLSNTFVFGIVGVFKENGIYICLYTLFGVPKISGSWMDSVFKQRRLSLSWF